MGHKRILEVPEEVYEPLAKTANLAGLTPERLAVEWLTAASCHASRDPVEDFIGTFRSCVPDWADQHDHHIGQALNQGRSGETSAES
jgi:hypothetical protein